MIKEEKLFYDSTDDIKLCGLLSVVNGSDKILILSHGINSYKERRSFNVFINGGFIFCNNKKLLF